MPHNLKIIKEDVSSTNP